MNDYDVEEQRLAAIQTLKAKHNQLCVEGERLAETNNFGLFSELCESLIKLEHNNKQHQLQMYAEFGTPVIQLALRCFKITRYITRLKQGEDPRNLLLEIMSNE